MTHVGGIWFPAISGVLRRPDLWWTARRQLRSLIRPRWWARSPFLPLPDRRYVRFRLETAYGSAGAPCAADVIRYLEWCRSARHSLGA